MRELVFKIVVFTTILAIAQIVFASLTGFKDIPSTVRALEQQVDGGVDILFLGDSTLYKGAASDVDHSTVPEILDDLTPSMSVGGAYHDAYDVELFEYMCRNAFDRSHPPKVVVFPMHLRSFSLERNKRPEYQFVREKLFLSDTSPLFRSFFRPLAVFGFYDLDPISQEEFKDVMLMAGGKKLGTVGDLRALPQPIRKQQQIRAFFCCDLTPDHRNLLALRRIIRLCKKNSTELVAYIPPTDHYQGNQEIGPEFSEAVRANIAVIAEVMASEGSQIHDFAFDTDFQREDFATLDIPDSHLNAPAKRKLARKLLQAIRDSLPGDHLIADDTLTPSEINPDSQ